MIHEKYQLKFVSHRPSFGVESSFMYHELVGQEENVFIPPLPPSIYGCNDVIQTRLESITIKRTEENVSNTGCGNRNLDYKAIASF